MTKTRADLGFSAELDNFDPQAWTPKPNQSANDRPQREQVEEAARASGFKSREPAASAQAIPEAPVRRRRTGRNVQFNIKAKPETIEAFCRIADAKGWGLGETLEVAVALLEREHQSRQGG
jgi:hypothetical protein